MRTYLKIVFAGLAAIFLYNYFASLLRALGNSMVPLLFLALSAGLNIVLDLVFVAGLHFGVEGAAIATVISRYVELAIVAGWTHSHKARNAFIVGAYRSMYIPGKLLRSITIKGMPLLVNEFLWSSGMAVLSQCYSTCGLDVVPAVASMLKPRR